MLVTVKFVADDALITPLLITTVVPSTLTPPHVDVLAVGNV